MAHTILNVSRDEALLRTRGEILRSEGFEVVAAMNIQEVIQACEVHKLDAIVVGHTIPPREQLRIVTIVHEKCRPGIPIVALFTPSQGDAAHCDYAVDTRDGPAALVAILRRLFPPDSTSETP